MKKYLLLFTLLTLLSIDFYAQSETDFTPKLILGGDANIHFSSTVGFFQTGRALEYTKFNNSSITLSPYIGKELSPRWAAGASFLLNYNRLGTDSPSFVSQNGYAAGVGLWARYIVNSKHRLKLYFRPEANVSRSWFKRGSESYNHTDQYVLGLGSGIMYDITDRSRILFNFGGVSYSKNNGLRVDYGISNAKLGLEFRF